MHYSIPGISMPLQAIHALCWTLFHSLWLGIVAALFVLVVVKFTRGAKPAVRYNLLLSVLFLCVGGTLLIFLKLMASGRVVTGGGIPATDVSLFPAAIAPVIPNDIAPGFWHKLPGLLDANAGFLVFIWFGVFVFRFTRFLVDIAALQRLKYFRATPAPADWQVTLQSLAHGLGIQREVALLESLVVKVPCVIGHLKPVILLPAGLIYNLPDEQLEAILMHELGHIRRADYMVNIFQSFVEMLFFFNPAILWISSAIREEREYCCDDLTLAGGQRKDHYIRALVAFEEFRQGQMNMAMFLTGKKMPLLSRVERMVSGERRKTGAPESALIITGLLLLGVLSVFGAGHLSDNKNILPIAPNSVFMEDTTKKPYLMIRFKNAQGEDVRAVLDKNNQVSALYVNNRLLPADSISAYQSVIRQLEEQKKKDDAQLQKDNEKMQQDNEQMKKDNEKMRLANEQMTKDNLALHEKNDKMAADKKKLAGMKRELVKQGVLNNENDLQEIGLTNTELIVNGKKQPDNIHQLFKTKYLNSETGAIHFKIMK